MAIAENFKLRMYNYTLIDYWSSALARNQTAALYDNI